MCDFEPATTAEKFEYGAVALPLLALIRAATSIISTRDALDLSGHLAEQLANRRQRTGPKSPEALSDRELHLMETALHRASTLLPATRCLQRAIAGRLWLAAHGLSSEIVLGVARHEDTNAETADADTRADLTDTGPFRGHAWLEPSTRRAGIPAPRPIFDHPDIDYRELYRR